MTASTTIEASPEAVFAVLADPRSHAATDDAGWVRERLDPAPIQGAGQVLRTAMSHENHRDEDDEMAHRVVRFAPAPAIAGKPGPAAPGTDELGLGGWVWPDELVATGAATTVTLTDDWSAPRIPRARPSGSRSSTRRRSTPRSTPRSTTSLDHVAELVA